MLKPFSPSRVAVVAAFPPPPAGMTLQAERLVALLRRDGAAVVTINTNPFGRRYPRLKRLLLTVRELPRMRRCDLAVIFAGSYASFFAFTAVPLAYARSHGVPAVVMYKGGWADAFMKRWGWLVRRWLRSARAVVVPGEFYREVFARFGVRAEVIPDILEAGPVAARPAGTRRVIINPRRHDYTAGTDVLIKAFAQVAARVADVDLFLYGEGRDTPRYRTLAGPLADTRIFFRGFISPKELRARLAEATLLVNANRFDNHPNSILEAMTAGIPVVATAVGGVPYLIQDGVTGFLCPPDDPVALADRMVYVLENPAEAEAAAARARAAAPAFIWDYGRPGHLAELVRVAGLPAGQ